RDALEGPIAPAEAQAEPVGSGDGKIELAVAVQVRRPRPTTVACRWPRLWDRAEMSSALMRVSLQRTVIRLCGHGQVMRHRATGGERPLRRPRRRDQCCRGADH